MFIKKIDITFTASYTGTDKKVGKMFFQAFIHEGFIAKGEGSQVYFAQNMFRHAVLQQANSVFSAFEGMFKKPVMSVSDIHVCSITKKTFSFNRLKNDFSNICSQTFDEDGVMYRNFLARLVFF